MLLVAASAVSAFLITIAELPLMVVELMQPLVDSPTLLMLCIMLFIMVVGMVMDLTPTVLILVPVLMPLIKDAGINPVYFGVLFILNCSIGLITPPVGNVLNVITGVSRLPFETCVRGVLPYLASMLGLLLLSHPLPVIDPDAVEMDQLNDLPNLSRTQESTDLCDRAGCGFNVVVIFTEEKSNETEKGLFSALLTAGLFAGVIGSTSAETLALRI